MAGCISARLVEGTSLPLETCARLTNLMLCKRATLAQQCPRCVSLTIEDPNDADPALLDHLPALQRVTVRVPPLVRQHVVDAVKAAFLPRVRVVEVVAPHKSMNRLAPLRWKCL